MPDAPIDQTALDRLRADFRARLAATSDRDLKSLHDEFLGRKSGAVTGLMKTLGSLPPEARREFGAQIPALTPEIEAALAGKTAAGAAGRRALIRSRS